ncbi:MAG TPA: HupE/UreJ family protein [Sphingobacteriaceae bacterium]
MFEHFALYFELGWQHILDLQGYDHILFVAVLCGIYLIHDWRKVLILVTAFTVGHSITLALSVYNHVRFDTSVIEFLIPVTIVITAALNIFRKNNASGNLTLSYIMALVFGLVHGLGFSNYLKSLLGSESFIVQELLAFNIGLEIGQIVIVAGILAASFIAVQIFNVKKREWNLFLSSAILGIAFMMALERLPVS